MNSDLFVRIAYAGVALVCVAATPAWSLDLSLLGKPNFELVGTVLDADTKQPIEGAYVVATYKALRTSSTGVASYCIKTAGMYTGPDGKYHFEIDKLDGRSPYTTNAIKTDYFWVFTKNPKGYVFEKQNADAYSGRDIFLKKQDPANADFRLSNGEEVCYDAPTREAARAGADFLKYELQEETKYGASKQGREATERQIRRLESLPEAQINAPK